MIKCDVQIVKERKTKFINFIEKKNIFEVFLKKNYSDNKSKKILATLAVRLKNLFDFCYSFNKHK